MLRFALAVVFSYWTITDAVRIAEEDYKDSKDSNAHVKAHVNKTSPLKRHRLSTQPINGDGPLAVGMEVAEAEPVEPGSLEDENTPVEAVYYVDCIPKVGSCSVADHCAFRNAKCVNRECMCDPGMCGLPALEAAGKLAALAARGGLAVGGLTCQGERIGAIATSNQVTNLGRGFEGNLGDSTLTAMLAAVSADVYNFEDEDHVLGNPPKLKLLAKRTQKDQGWFDWLRGKKSMPGGSVIQYGIYEIIDEGSKHKGERILSFRGTWTWKGVWQDKDLMGKKAWSADDRSSQDHRFAKAVQQALETLEANGHMTDGVKISYVTGHSLGAALAEILAWKTMTRGAGFNGPAICSPMPEHSWCNAPGQDQQTHGAANKLAFEVWITDNDPVSIGSAVKTSVDDGHITRPKRARCDQSGSIHIGLSAHSMDCMMQRVGRLTEIA